MEKKLLMSRALVASLVLLPGLVLAQVDGGVAPAAAAGAAAANDTEALRREFEGKLEAARREVKELRDEMHAQQGTQPASQGWQENWVDEKRKLELVTFDGYLRVRPELFYRFDLGWGTDAAGYSLWPRSPVSNVERTELGVNMRFRLEPTINVSEEVRIRAQIDALDNVVWGSTPDYAYSLNGNNGYAYDLNQFSLFSTSQVAPTAGINALTNSVAMKRVWGEVGTPIGILRFGRMGSHWGLGMLYNDGNGIDSDYGDTVDRISFTAEPIPGFYITPMIDISVAGSISLLQSTGGQAFDTTQSDNVTSYILVLARRDTESERRAKLEANQTVFNYGLHFMYRVQRNDSVGTLSQPFNTGATSNTNGTVNSINTVSGTTWVPRGGALYVPDIWAKVEQKNFRVELEAAAILGSIQNRALTGANGANPLQDQSLYLYQFGGVLQGEYRFLNGDLEIGAEVGFASGDSSPGYGYFTRRDTRGVSYNSGQYIDGPQYNCSTIPCPDNTITNFRFNQDYRVDMILYREILGGITDSIYIKPRARYRITQGFEAFASFIYSRAVFLESVPGYAYGANDPSLGIEINAGVRYETEDGFFGQLQYGILFPLGAFAKNAPGAPVAVSLDNAQALRAVLGIKF
jgi:uncharacterized protein (TIGR04551 family)